MSLGLGSGEWHTAPLRRVPPSSVRAGTLTAGILAAMRHGCAPSGIPPVADKGRRGTLQARPCPGEFPMRLGSFLPGFAWVAVGALMPGTAAVASEVLAAKGGCAVCHPLDRKRMGPSG